MATFSNFAAHLFAQSTNCFSYRRAATSLVVFSAFFLLGQDFAAAQGAGASQIARDAGQRLNRDDSMRREQMEEEMGMDDSSEMEEMEMQMEDMGMEDMGMDEMGMEDMGMNMRSGGSRRGSTRTGSAGDSYETVFLQSRLAGFRTAFSTADFGPLAADPGALGLNVDAGPVLRSEAENAYKGGNYPLAMQLYFAHMVMEYDQAHTQLKMVKYNRHLKRPVWRTRWGVSYTVRGEVGALDPSPIREGATRPGSGRAGGNQRQRGGGFGGEEMGMEMEQEMGQMEEEMAGQMDEEMGMEMEMEFGGEGRRGGGRNGGGDSMATMAMAPARTMLHAKSRETLDKYLGLVATVVAKEFGKRYQQGDFGNALTSVQPNPTDGDGVAVRPRGPVDDLLDSSAETLPLWIPGVVFIGEGESKDIIRSAYADKIEFVLHFDIVIKMGRNETVQNISRCRLLSIKTGKSLGVSKGIDSNEVAQLVRVGRESSETSYVTNQLSSLFAVIDRDAKSIDMPRLSPEVAKKRIGSLLGSTGIERLRALAEARLYQAQELLTADDVEAVFQIMGGQEGLSILHAPTETKLGIAREWAVGALK